MPFTAAGFAKKLKEVRESIGISAAALSDATGITADRLGSFEAATIAPTGDEVLILADHFRRDFGWFIEDEASDSDDNLRELFRFEGEKLSIGDRYAINEFLYLCKSQSLVEELLELPKRSAPFHFAPAGRNAFAEGEACAVAFRKFHRLPPTAVIPDIFHWLRENGIRVFRRCLPDSKISGLFVNHPVAGPCILVNFSEDPYRQRFSAAHETGHALMDANAPFNVSEKSDDNSDADTEKRANMFASRFLMPRAMLRAMGGTDWWKSPDNVSAAAGRIHVSVPALLTALKMTKLIDEETRNELRGMSLKPDGKRDPELEVGFTAKQTERAEAIFARGLNRQYVGQCFEARRRELISRGKLAEMLLTDGDGVAEISALFGESTSRG